MADDLALEGRDDLEQLVQMPQYPATDIYGYTDGYFSNPPPSTSPPNTINVQYHLLPKTKIEYLHGKAESLYHQLQDGAMIASRLFRKTTIRLTQVCEACAS